MPSLHPSRRRLGPRFRIPARRATRPLRSSGARQMHVPRINYHFSAIAHSCAPSLLRGASLPRSPGPPVEPVGFPTARAAPATSPTRATKTARKIGFRAILSRLAVKGSAQDDCGETACGGLVGIDNFATGRNKMVILATESLGAVHHAADCSSSILRTLSELVRVSPQGEGDKDGLRSLVGNCSTASIRGHQ